MTFYWVASYNPVSGNSSLTTPDNQGEQQFGNTNRTIGREQETQCRTADARPVLRLAADKATERRGRYLDGYNISGRTTLYVEDGSGFFNRLTAELFRRLDIDYQLSFMPAQRSLVSTNNGTTDVIIGRTAAIEKKLPNLVRVPVNILDFDFTAYTKDPTIRIDRWDSLNPYIVGIINGWKIVEQNVAGSREVVKVNEFGQLLTLLDKGRVEVAILDRVMGEWTFRELGLELKINKPPLTSKPNFIYLHKKHRDLIPEITSGLLQMQQDGSFDAIYADAIKPE